MGDPGKEWSGPSGLVALGVHMRLMSRVAAILCRRPVRFGARSWFLALRIFLSSRRGTESRRGRNAVIVAISAAVADHSTDELSIL